MSFDSGAWAAQSPAALELDPFAFTPELASCIAGLGGNAPGHNPDYAFHTAYVPVARGRASFHLQFHHLKATQGSLIVRVHMLPDEPGAIARLANSVRVQLNRLAYIGGGVRIEFEGFRGFKFAVLGLVSDQTDALAEGLTVTLACSGILDDVVKATRDDPRPSPFTRTTLRPVTQLASKEVPTLAEPVSQPCTPGQLAEPVWAEWADRLNPALSRAQLWPAVYSFQVLHRYGLSNEATRGARFGDEDLIYSALDVDSERSAEDCPGGLDYLCSFDLLATGGNGWRETLARISSAIERLRPGGLGIFLITVTMDEANKNSDNVMTRADLERLTMILISRHHEVAQLKWTDRACKRAEDGLSPFGMILRRAPAEL